MINMKCPTCQKDFEKGVEAAYKLGLQDGHERHLKTISLLETVHRHLWDEINRLDRNYPVIEDPNHITITFSIKQLQRIIHSLRGTNNYYAQFLSKRLKDRRRNLAALVDDICKWVSYRKRPIKLNRFK